MYCLMYFAESISVNTMIRINYIQPPDDTQILCNCKNALLYIRFLQLPHPLTRENVLFEISSCVET